MRTSSYLLMLALLALVGCAEEPTAVTTTTTTTQVTTAGPAREVVVTRAPPPVRVETQTVAPAPGYIWTRGYWRWTGTTYGWVPGHLGKPPKTSRSLGGRPLDASLQRLGVDSRTLAVTDPAEDPYQP